MRRPCAVNRLHETKRINEAQVCSQLSNVRTNDNMEHISSRADMLQCLHKNTIVNCYLEHFIT